MQVAAKLWKTLRNWNSLTSPDSALCRMQFPNLKQKTSKSLEDINKFLAADLSLEHLV